MSVFFREWHIPLLAHTEYSIDNIIQEYSVWASNAQVLLYYIINGDLFGDSMFSSEVQYKKRDKILKIIIESKIACHLYYSKKEYKVMAVLFFFLERVGREVS